VPRFRFEQFWTKLHGFIDVVCASWGAWNPDIDPCRALDLKLHHLARALKSWRATKVGDVRLQLAASRVIIYELNTA